MPTNWGVLSCPLVVSLRILRPLAWFMWKSNNNTYNLISYYGHDTVLAHCIQNMQKMLSSLCGPLNAYLAYFWWYIITRIKNNNKRVSSSISSSGTLRRHHRLTLIQVSCKNESLEMMENYWSWSHHGLILLFETIVWNHGLIGTESPNNAAIEKRWTINLFFFYE